MWVTHGASFVSTARVKLLALITNLLTREKRRESKKPEDSSNSIA